MRVSIARIKNNALRRGVLLAATIPLAIATPIIGALYGAWETSIDFAGAWRTAWRGHQPEYEPRMTYDEAMMREHGPDTIRDR